MVLNKGIITSQLGTWRYWETENFSEKDLQLFLSEEDKLSKSMTEVMQEYHEDTIYMKNQVDYVSYRFSGYKVAEVQDKYFTVLEKNEEMRKMMEKDRI